MTAEDKSKIKNRKPKIQLHGYLLVRSPVGAADAWAVALGALPGVTGIEERPASGAPLFTVDPSFAVVEYGTGTAAAFDRWLRAESFRGRNDVLLCVYVAVADTVAWRRWLRALPRRCPGLAVVRHGLLAPRDHPARAQRRWRGRRVGRRLWVGPPWSRPPPGRVAVVIEPGRAFGTGDHPTTRLCLAALDRLARRGFRARRVFDVGTGSGVLAIAAARLFRGCQLWLSDLDEQCAAPARRNLARHHLARRVRRGFWGAAARPARVRSPAGGFDLVLANLYLESLQHLARPAARWLRPGGRWIVSGMLAGDQENEFLSHVPATFRVAARCRAADRRLRGALWQGLTAARQAWVCVELERTTSSVRGGSSRAGAACVR